METTSPRPQTVYVDADACPVKDEVYRVTDRYSLRVVVVANATLAVPTNPRISMVVQRGFGVVDDWIAEQVQLGDLVVTADVPLAARSVAKGAIVVDTKGRLLTEANVADALAARDLMEYVRQSGEASGGPSAMTPRDRSRFLAKLDEAVHLGRKRLAARIIPRATLPVPEVP